MGLIKELGLVVAFALAMGVGVGESIHCFHLCVAHIERAAKLLKQGDPPQERR
jgi:hypothetical protein